MTSDDPFSGSLFRFLVMPLRLHLYKPKGQSGPRYRKLTDRAAAMIREFQVPAGVQARVLFDAFYLSHLHLVCLAHLMLTHHAMDCASAQAIQSNKEVRLPPIEQRIESLRRAHRDERIRKLFRKGSLHARFRQKLDTILQAA